MDAPPLDTPPPQPPKKKAVKKEEFQGSEAEYLRRVIRQMLGRIERELKKKIASNTQEEIQIKLIHAFFGKSLAEALVSVAEIILKMEEAGLGRVAGAAPAPGAILSPEDIALVENFVQRVQQPLIIEPAPEQLPAQE